MDDFKKEITENWEEDFDKEFKKEEGDYWKEFVLEMGESPISQPMVKTPSMVKKYIQSLINKAKESGRVEERKERDMDAMDKE